VTIGAILHLPHGELDEPRTAALPSGKSASLKAPRSNLQTKISVAVYPRSPNLSYPDVVLSMGTASGAVRSGERIGASDGG
jgi:hypothetical protein